MLFAIIVMTSSSSTGVPDKVKVSPPIVRLTPAEASFAGVIGQVGAGTPGHVVPILCAELNVEYQGIGEGQCGSNSRRGHRHIRCRTCRYASIGEGLAASDWHGCRNFLWIGQNNIES